MNFTRKSATLLVVSMLCSAAGLDAAPLTVTADIDGGSAEVLSIDPDAASIHIQPALRMGRGWPCWWYFRVDGATAGRPMTLKLSGNPGAFRPKGAAHAPEWAQPVRAAISADDHHWTQTGDVEMDPSTKTAVYRFNAPATRFWMAWGAPYLSVHAAALLEETAAALPGDSRLFTLATSREGRAVQGIRIGNPDAPAAIWVQARQHAWESGSSWVGQGFLKWLAGDDPMARSLRATAEIRFIPIMDVDNVAAGAGGKGALPRDHNRDWTGQPHYPEVAAAQQQIMELEQAGRLRLFIDIHNPSPIDTKSFFYSPADCESMPDPVRANYNRWLTLAVSEITSPVPLQPDYRFPDKVRTEKERASMSAVWVKNHTAPERVISVTLEALWNTPQSTPDGYQQMGAQVGRAMARFLTTQ
jgi:hypothetical protein